MIVFILSLLFLSLFGFVSAAALDSQNKYFFGEKIALSFPLGAAAITQIMLLSALLRINFNIAVINSIFGLLLFFLLSYAYKAKRKFNIKPLNGAPKSLISRLLILIIIFQIIFIAAEAAMRPVYSFDALDNWAMKTKSFFYENKVSLDKTSSYFMGGSHANYPLQTPFLAAWLYFNQGQIRDDFINFIPALYYIALLALVYINLKKYLIRKKALIFTFFLATAPLFIYHGFNFYADLPLSFYLTAAVIYLYNYLRQSYSGDFLLGVFMCGLMVFIKSNGLFYAIIILAVFSFEFWRLKKIKILDKTGLLIAVVGLLIFSLPWLIYVYVNKLGYITTNENKIMLNSFHPEIIKLFFMNLWFAYDFFIWFAILPIFIFLFVKTAEKSRLAENAFIIAVFLALLFFHFSIFLFTELYIFILDGSLDGKLSLIIFPISIFTAGIFYEKNIIDLKTGESFNQRSISYSK